MLAHADSPHPLFVIASPLWIIDLDGLWFLSLVAVTFASFATAISLANWQ